MLIFFHDEYPKYPIVHIIILNESSPIKYIAKDVKAPKNADIAIPTISKLEIFLLEVRVEILNIINETIRLHIKPNIP